MSDLSIAIIQTELLWENISGNLSNFSNLLDQKEAELYVLPEMFSTGFTMHPEPIAEKHTESKALQWIKDEAVSRKTAITGSIALEVDGNYVNRLVFAHPDGSTEFYDKRHLFRMAGEHKRYKAGAKQLLINYKGWKITGFVCYDLRFGVWSRNTTQYGLAIYVANWPAARTYPWDILLKARAIENQCYVVGCNRIGKDANEIEYEGHSLIIDPKGQPIRTGNNKEEILTALLSKSELDEFREKFPVHLDADEFKIL